MSVRPAAARWRRAMSRIVTPAATGSSVFGSPSVSGRSRRPAPAASTSPITNASARILWPSCAPGHGCAPRTDSATVGRGWNLCPSRAERMSKDPPPGQARLAQEPPKIRPAGGRDQAGCRGHAGTAGRVRVMRTVAVVLAGGSSERFGTPVPKQLLPLAGRPMIEHSVAAFEQAPAVDRILVVMAAGHAEQVRGPLRTSGYAKLSSVIDGGPTRSGSTRCAIAELGDDECDVLFHDAARPLVSQQTIADCVAALADHRAVGGAVPSSDTIAVVSDGLMTAIPRRGSLARCQTPQGFRLSVVRRAFQLDDAHPWIC